MEVSVNFTPRPLYPHKDRIPSEQGAGGLAPKPDWMLEQKNPLLLTVFEPWNAQPIAYSLYRICCPAPLTLRELCLYTEYLIPAMI